MAGCGVEFENDMRGHGTRERAGWPVLGTKRGKLSLQASRNVARLEQFPAIRMT